jgi:SAM-dependent methyltransferase
MRKLEIGGGRNPVEGYEVLDLTPNAKHRAEWGVKPLPFPDETFDEVYSSHTIEHIPWYDVQKAVNEVYRILKPDGIIEIHTVNFDYLLHYYKINSVGDNWNARGRNKEMHPFKWMVSRLFNLPDRDEGLCSPNWHRGAFNYSYLKEILKNAGFKNFIQLRKQKGNITRSPVNVGIRGIK